MTNGVIYYKELEIVEKVSKITPGDFHKKVMIGMEINLSKDLLASKIFAFRCLEKETYFGYIGDKQRVIRILTPLGLNQNECDTIIKVVQETVMEMHNSIPAETIDKVKKYTLGW